MPPVRQLVSGLVIFVILLVLLSLALYVFLFALAIGLLAGAYVFIKRLLVEKGILKSRGAAPAYAEDEDANAAVIEVEYHEVDSDSPRDPRP